MFSRRDLLPYRPSNQILYHLNTTKYLLDSSELCRIWIFKPEFDSKNFHNSTETFMKQSKWKNHFHNCMIQTITTTGRRLKEDGSWWIDHGSCLCCGLHMNNGCGVPLAGISTICILQTAKFTKRLSVSIFINGSSSSRKIWKTFCPRRILFSHRDSVAFNATADEPRSEN